MRRPCASALLMAASVAAIAPLTLFGVLARPQALAAGPTVPDLAADTFPQDAHFANGSVVADAEPHQPDLIFSVNFSHDWVLGEYPVGHTVWLTVTNATGTVKATAELTTMAGVPNWGGTGFATWMDDTWQSRPPDLEPGDWVHGAVDNGRTASVQIGRITGEMDVNADSITGTVDVAWRMPGPLDVFCRGWGAPAGAPEKQDSVIPNGVDPYTCAWDPNGRVQPHAERSGACRLQPVVSPRFAA